jgi:hypothetical protein
VIFFFYYFNATPKIKNCKQAAHFAKRNTKFAGGTPEAIPLWRDATGQEARAGKNFYPVGSRSDSFGAFPPTPFLFARPSVKVFQNSAFGFSLKKVPARGGQADFVPFGVKLKMTEARLRHLACVNFSGKVLHF